MSLFMFFRYFKDVTFHPTFLSGEHFFDTVSPSNMFENGLITVKEGKCRRFGNSSEYLKTRCASKN